MIPHFKSLSRRAALAVALCALTLGTAVHAGTHDNYPQRPIKIAVPFPPGGAADTFARLIGQKLQERWGQPAVIENRPGGGGLIATQYTVQQPADGYNFLVVTVGHAVNPSLHKSLPFDTEKDLVPVAMLASLPNMLVMHPSVPAQTVPELIGLLKANPGKYSYASSGNATTSHVAGAMFTSGAQVDMLHVPYRGSAPAIADLISGQVHVMFDPVASATQHVRANRLRALAVTTPKRSPLVPDLPTMQEAGVQGYDFSAWFLMLAPAGTPQAIIDKVHAEVAAILKDADIQERYQTLGAEPGQGSPAELRAFVSAEIKRYAALVEATGMKID